jgi:predicted ABC-type sugar transport system permease subunit
MPIKATCTGTAMPAVRHTCNSCRARASLTAKIPMGVGNPSSQVTRCSTALFHWGALVLTSVDNGMSMLDVDSYWQMVVKGSILVLGGVGGCKYTSSRR